MPAQPMDAFAITLTPGPSPLRLDSALLEQETYDSASLTANPVGAVQENVFPVGE